ncbi:MAG: hypothetical protein HYV09_36610 [Deltaproteobacteria bacterium]|nr:hypothetical protein [Deltaproteobacteria bacterium]
MRANTITTWTLAAVITSFALSCGPDSRDSLADAGEPVGSASQALSVDAGLFSQDDFRAAALCPACEVLHSARLNLPETKVVAASAKLRAPDGSFPVVTIDATGKLVDEKKLFDAEHATVRAKYGKLRPDLHAWVAAAPEGERAWVWIWADVPIEPSDRAELARSESAQAAHRAKIDAALDAKLTPIRKWLATNAPEAELGDRGGPLVRARLTAAQVRAIEALPQIAQLGTDRYPGEATGSPWGTASQWGPSIRLAEAHTLATGTGRICIKELTRPDSYAYLDVALTADPSGTADEHTRVTTGLIKNTHVTTAPWRSVAPHSTVYVANVTTADSWCLSNYATTMSFTRAINAVTAGAPNGTDAQHDWLAYGAWPPVLVVASAGRIDPGTPGAYYVANRGFNGLVVGGVSDTNTGDRSDDTWHTESAWGNPLTAHGDYELPHVAAPANGLSAANATLTGTSAATALVAGISSLIEARDSVLGWQPMQKRAIIMATATGRADQPALTGLPSGEHKIGTGVVDAYQATQLASPAYAVSASGYVTAEHGRTALDLYFPSSFGSDSYLTPKWKARAARNGRLRVVITWKATANCPPTGCTSATIDADLDLHLFKKTDGSWTTTTGVSCYSSTWDSPYELCDVPVVQDDEYMIGVKKYANNTTWTSLALAWYHYQLPSGTACTLSTECASATCSAGRCTCATDSDCPDRRCVSSQCTPKLALGAGCTNAAECASGICTEGVCCNSACTATCYACTAARKGWGVDGACEPIDQGVVPPSGCQPASCSAGVMTRAEVCDGDGACMSDGTTSCGAYQCATWNTCASSCTSDAGCKSGYWCNAPACVAKKNTGLSCVEGRECLSGSCVEGVCCNEACVGTCRSCLASKTGSADGFCSGITNGTDPDGECAAQACSAGTLSYKWVCDGAGACRSNSSISCAPYTCATASTCGTTCANDGGCTSTHYCAGSSCVAKKANGATCAAANECTSGSCVDGVCCDEACAGTCVACSAAKKGSGTDGECGPIANGTNPDDECARRSCLNGVATNAEVCDGGGACRSNGITPCGGFQCGGDDLCRTACADDAGCMSTYWCNAAACVPKKANGVGCGAGRECSSGQCVDGVCCNSACSAQCAACDAAGSIGTCTTISGTVHGVRPACAGSGACGSLCDGVNAEACTYPTVGTSCSDSNLCNGAETCDGGGSCLPGAPLVIDDSDDCTTDSCDPATGEIAHAPVLTGTCGERIAPTWPATASLTWTQLSPTSAHLTWAAATHLVAIAGYRVLRDDVPVATLAASTLAWDATDLTTGTAYRFRVEAFAASSADTTTGPRAIVAVATPLSAPAEAASSSTVSTGLQESTGFLYSGSDPVQKGVTAGEVKADRACVLRGRVADLAGAALAGARVEILGHTELGYTLSRTDGMYDLVVNGGGRVTVRISLLDHVTVQRTVDTEVLQWVRVPEVVLTPKDAAREVTLGGSSWVVAESTPVDDATPSPLPGDGERHATLLFQPGTVAKRVTDGSASSLPSPTMHVRATEVTRAGLAGMPGELPANVAFTYAISLDVDEAAGADRVVFVDSAGSPKPVVFYVNAVVGFPAGSVAPLGYYDPKKATWVAYDNGLVVKLVSVDAGKAMLDVTGDGVADADSVLDGHGISVAERQQLAGRHAAGSLLWRVALPHFSTWDINWGVVPPAGATPPKPKPIAGTTPDPCPTCGSIVLSENQVLGERLPIAGTPLTLEYWSDRVEGYRRGYTAQVRISEGAMPTDVRRAIVEWHVAGRVFTQTFGPGPDQVAVFTWDGRDAYGRKIYGRQPLKVRVGYVYAASYGTTSLFGYNAGGMISGVRNGGSSGGGIAATSIAEGPAKEYSDELTFWAEWRGGIGVLPSKGQGLGAWDFGQHHSFDKASRTLVMGTGERRRLDGVNDLVMQRLTTEVARAVVRTSAGVIYFIDAAGTSIRKLEGSPPVSTEVVAPSARPSGVDKLDALALDASEQLHVVSDLSHAVLRVDGSSLTTIVGTPGVEGFEPAEGVAPATNAKLRRPTSIAFGPDGSMFIADWGNGCVRRVAPDGLISRYAGAATGSDQVGGVANSSLDGKSALEVKFFVSNTHPLPSALAVGPDGTLFVLMRGDVLDGGASIWRIDPLQRLFRVAGGAGQISGDGGRATEASTWPARIELARNGTLYIRELDSWHGSPALTRLRAISTDGIIQTIGLNGADYLGARDGAVWDGHLQVGDMFAEPTGSLLLAGGGYGIWRISASTDDAAVGLAGTAVPSPDGQQVYLFDSAGRQVSTRDALTGKSRYSFAYDSLDRLASISDLENAVGGDVRPLLRIDHVSATQVDLVARYGQITRLTLDGDRLVGVADPEDIANSRVSRTFTYDAGGLLKTYSEPNGVHRFEWHPTEGTLTKDSNPAGGSLDLLRSSLAGGWRVTLTDGLGLETKYDIEDKTSGTDVGKQLATVFFPDGTSRIRKTTLAGDMAETLVGATVGGTAGATTSSNDTSLVTDPLFGRVAPMKTTARTTGGMTLTTSTASSVTPTGATWLNFSTRTDTTTVHGAFGPVATSDTVITRTLNRTLSSGQFVGGSLVTRTSLGRQTSMNLDSRGRPTKLQIPGVADVDYGWTNGQLTSVTQGSRVTTLNYRTGTGQDGTLESVVDALGRTHSFTEYDLTGRLKKQTLPGGQQTEATYDLAGNLATLKPPGRPLHELGYTAANQLETYKAPLPESGSTTPRVTSYEYDVTRFMTKVTLPDDATIRYTRVTGSPMTGRLDQIFDSRGETKTYSYQASTGHLLSIAAESPAAGGGGDAGTDAEAGVDADAGAPATPGVSLSFGYNGSLPTSTTWTWPVGTPTTTVLESTFDNHFRVVSQKVIAGAASSEVALRYDADGQLATAGPVGSPTMTLTRNQSTATPPVANNGFLTNVLVGSVEDVRTYNTYGELSTYTARVSGGADLLSINYEPTIGATQVLRDSLGRIVKKTESVLGGTTTTVGYVYDTAGRLWKVTNASDQILVEYGYGANGARTTKKVYGTAGVESSATTISAIYDDQDRLKTYDGVTYTYRASGELASKSDGTTYSYDGVGNLREVELSGTTIEYLVDPQNRRVGKIKDGTLERRWVYDGQLRIVGELAGGTLTQYVYATRPNVPEYLLRAGAVYRVLTDHLGSVRLVVKASDGTVMQRMEYDEFGIVNSATEFVASGWDPVPFGFAGGLYDRDTGLVRFGARDYHPETGRWTAKDPIRFAGGDTNLYGYCKADPVNLVDITGRAFAPPLPWFVPWGPIAIPMPLPGFAAGVAGTIGGLFFPTDSPGKPYRYEEPFVPTGQICPAVPKDEDDTAVGDESPDDCTDQCAPYFGRGKRYRAKDGNTYVNGEFSFNAYFVCLGECRGLR